MTFINLPWKRNKGQFDKIEFSQFTLTATHLFCSYTFISKIGGPGTKILQQDSDTIIIWWLKLSDIWKLPFNDDVNSSDDVSLEEKTGDHTGVKSHV